MKAAGELELKVGARIPVYLDTTRAHVFADRSDHAPNITLPPGFPQQQA